jgi:hypothetical protein
LNGDEVKIVYDDPWFWKISKSKVARPQPKTKPHYSNNNSSSKTHKKPRVLSENEEEINTLKKQLKEQQKLIETLQLKINVQSNDDENGNSTPEYQPTTPEYHPSTPEYHPSTPAYESDNDDEKTE